MGDEDDNLGCSQFIQPIQFEISDIKGYIYILFDFTDRLLKIGRTEKSPFTRLGEIQSPRAPHIIALLVYGPGSKSLERFLRDCLYADERIPKSEWFIPSDRMNDMVRVLRGGKVNSKNWKSKPVYVHHLSSYQAVGWITTDAEGEIAIIQEHIDIRNSIDEYDYRKPEKTWITPLC